MIIREDVFYDYVYEGISQLANYEDYFKYEQNKQYALENKSITVDDPRLYLIVGNCENFHDSDVAEASRMLEKRKGSDKKYVLIDYDTLNAMFFI